MDSKDFKRIEYKVKRSMSIQNLNFDNVLKIFLNKGKLYIFEYIYRILEIKWLVTFYILVLFCR